MQMNRAAPAKWVDRLQKRVGRAAALWGGLATLSGILASIWFFIAWSVGVEGALLLRALLSDILLFVLLYSAAAVLTLHEALHWYRRSGTRQRWGLSAAFLVAMAAITFTAYGDLRTRTREALVTKEVARIRAYGCTGDYDRSLRSIAQLTSSRRFNFLKSDLEALSNHERFLAYFKSALRQPADGLTLEERHMLFGIPNADGRPPQVNADLWRRWNDAVRDECR
jgi:hypothetical protein